MAYTDIDNPSDYFNTVLYTGNNTSQSITGVGFKPDWVWCKSRNDGNNHNVFDSVRGVTKWIETDNQNAEQTASNTLTSFNSDGFSVGDHGEINGGNDTQVSWCWKAGVSASNNTDGQLTSSVSVNQDAGFSVLTYTGVGNGLPATARTVGHGLGVTPAVLIIKNRADSTQFNVYHHKNTSAPQTEIIYLNLARGTADDNGFWNDTAPTSSVFTVGGDNGVNGNNDSMVCYAFAEKQGYSKFNSYVGNGNVDGTFIYTGFKPALVIQKESGADGEYWMMKDNKRETGNQTDANLYPNANNVEGDTNGIDLLSNGFKCRTTGAGSNGSGKLYIYMAFAEQPFVTSTGVPATAR